MCSGMSKSVVRRLVGLPHNNNNEFIWCWDWEDPQADTWQEMNGGFFLVFDKDGKLRYGFFKKMGIEKP